MIRQFEIWNRKFNTLEGHLYFDTETEKFSMTIEKEFTGKVDIMFDILNKQKVYNVPQHIVDNWVQSRVIPPDRQGLKGILEDAGMKEYHVPTLFFYCMGDCDMDYTYCKEITNDADNN